MDWTESIAAAVRSMERALGGARYGQGASLRAVSGAKLMLPYVLHPVPNMPEHWIWLNRSYKPLGTLSEWARYEDYDHLHVLRGDHRIERLIPECIEWGGGEGLALYDDFTDPCRTLRHARNYAALLALVDYETPNARANLPATRAQQE